MTLPRAVLLLSAMICANTFTIGAFPALLPEMGVAGHLADWQLGLLAAAFGLARTVSDLPLGALVARRFRQALVAAPLALAAGVGCLVSDGAFPVLVLGRALVGVGHALGMIAGLTAILRVAPAARMTAGLNAFEMGGMIGLLGGVIVVGSVPKDVPWNVALLVASLPQLVGLALLPRTLRSLDAAQSRDGGAAPERRPASTREVRSAPPLALVLLTATIMSIVWSATTQLVVPLRATREFALDRGHVALLLLVPQVTDVAILLPLGSLADRVRPTRMLGAILLVLAAATALVSFGGLSLVVVGSVLLGIGLAGWMLPLAIIREAAPERAAKRTAIYRVAVDTGTFLGPLLAGILGEGRTGVLSALTVALLVAVAPVFLKRRHESGALMS